MIRKAVDKDLPQIVTLLNQLGYVHTCESFFEVFQLYTTSDLYDLIVIEDKEIILGFIAYSFTRVFVTGQTRIHIEGLVIDLNHRRMGIGKKLMKYVEDIAATRKPCLVDLTSRVSRMKDGTHAFYSSLGFESTGAQEKTYFTKEFN
jgi:ribosomal protein S18 acetylase RimI-like enzyme